MIDETIKKYLGTKFEIDKDLTNGDYIVSIRIPYMTCIIDNGIYSFINEAFSEIESIKFLHRLNDKYKSDAIRYRKEVEDLKHGLKQFGKMIRESEDD